MVKLRHAGLDQFVKVFHVLLVVRSFLIEIAEPPLAKGYLIELLAAPMEALEHVLLDWSGHFRYLREQPFCPHVSELLGFVG